MYIIIGGGGKVGSVLARQLLDAGHEVAMIEQRQDVADAISKSFNGRRFMIMQGDCCDSQTMEYAGMRDADAFIVVCGHDDVNLVACEIARTVFHPSRIVARVNNPKNERIFSKMGITAVSSTTVVARMIVEETLSTQMRTVMTLRSANMTMFEMNIPHSTSLRAQGGIRVSDIDLPEQTVIVATSRGDDFAIVNASTVLQPDDTVLVCTKTSSEATARRVLLDL